MARSMAPGRLTRLSHRVTISLWPATQKEDPMALQNDLTTGDVNRHILRYASPLLLSNIFQALYNAVDMYFVGKYLGAAGLSAVSVSGSVMNILFMTIAGMSVGVSVVIGSHQGKGDISGLQKTAGTAISLYALCAVGITLLGLLFSPAILRLCATPQEAYPMAVAYLRIIFCGIPFTLGYHLICAFQRGFGDSRSSLLFVAIATCMNAVLDLILIRDFQLGARGAAIATVCSQALAFCLGVIYFRWKRHVISFAPRAWRWDIPSLKDLVRLGLPSALQQLSLNVSHLTLNGIVNTYGLVASAAYGIGVKLDSFAILPCNAINDAVAGFTSQNLGAGQEERALSSIRAAQKISLSVNAFLLVCIALLAPSLAGIFNDDPAVVQTAADYLHTVCMMYLLYAYVHPIIGFVKGSGNAMFTLVNGLEAQYLVRIPAALLLSKALGLGLTGVALAWICAPAFSTITYTCFLRRGKWKIRLQKARERGSVL